MDFLAFKEPKGSFSCSQDPFSNLNERLVDSAKNNILAKFQHPTSCSFRAARVKKLQKNCIFWHDTFPKNHHV
jgi:hypothetical protein